MRMLSMFEFPKAVPAPTATPTARGSGPCTCITCVHVLHMSMALKEHGWDGEPIREGMR